MLYAFTAMSGIANADGNRARGRTVHKSSRRFDKVGHGTVVTSSLKDDRGIESLKGKNEEERY